MLELDGVQWASQKNVVETVLGRRPEVVGAEANPVSQTVTVRYDPAHTTVEQLLASTHLSGTVLRPTAVFSSLHAGVGALIRPDGQVPLAFVAPRVNLIDARDVADAAATVLTEGGHDGRSYTLTGPQSLSGNDIVAALAHALGIPLQHVDLTPAALQNPSPLRGRPRTGGRSPLRPIVLLPQRLDGRHHNRRRRPHRASAPFPGVLFALLPRQSPNRRDDNLAHRPSTKSN